MLGEKGSESVAEIPGFVSEIDLSQAAVRLSIQSTATANGSGADDVAGAGGGAGASLSVCLALDIPGPDNTVLEFAFLQITSKPTPTTAPANIRNATKRMVKVSLGGLPWDKIPKVPVIDSVKPAFDSLAFYWSS